MRLDSAHDTSAALGASPGNRDVLTFGQLVDWAWRETPPVHANRANLLIHVVAVPVFVGAHVLAIVGAVMLDAWPIIAGVVLAVIPLVLQRRGHALERQPVHAFASTKDFVGRLYAKQFCNFWRFLFTGAWFASFKRAQR